MERGLDESQVRWEMSDREREGGREGGREGEREGERATHYPALSINWYSLERAKQAWTPWSFHTSATARKNFCRERERESTGSISTRGGGGRGCVYRWIFKLFLGHLVRPEVLQVLLGLRFP